eukprot:11160506-Lingulodinium_polyedra.AAC.1
MDVAPLHPEPISENAVQTTVPGAPACGQKVSGWSVLLNRRVMNGAKRPAMNFGLGGNWPW